MELFEQVLKKAGQEGHIDPRLITDRKHKIDAGNGKTLLKKIQLPPQLIDLPGDVIQDLLKITENLRQIAESQKLQIIGFASAVPGQGSTTLSALIALLMAAREKMTYEQNRQQQAAGQSVKKPQKQLGVLLVDTQFQNPSLHYKFGLKQQGGLAEIFENEIPAARALKSIPHTPLKMICTGVHKNFHLTQNHLSRLSSILNKAKENVEFIFLDIPPLLAYSEGISLSRLCNGIVLVIRAGESRWEVMVETRRQLERSGVNILGAVLNRREYFIPNWAYRNI